MINNNINNGNINNGIVNNNNIINIIPLGNEKLNDILSDNEKISILNKKHNCINELIHKIHISSDEKYKKFIRLVWEN